MYERTYHKTVLKTDEKPSKKKGGARINWKVVLLIAGAIVIVVGSIFLIRMPHAQVKTITVVGANVVDPGDLSEFVTNQLQGNDVFILPRTSIFIISEHTLEKEIKNAFPRIQSVQVHRTNFSTLTVTIQEYQGIYLWCTDPATCDFMDQNGIVFSPAPYFSGNAYPKLFIGGPQQLPFQALSTDQLATVALLLSHLPMVMIVPQEFHFVSDHELDVDFNHDGQQAQLRFDPTLDINDSLEALYTGLRTDPLMTKFQDPTQVLQYIDLRFLDRVVYKFQ